MSKIKKLIDKLFSCSEHDLVEWMELQEETNREMAHYMIATDARLLALESGGTEPKGKRHE